MHGLLQKVLEDTQNVSVPWVISSADLVPPSIFLVAPVQDSNSSSSFSNRSGNHRGSGARSPAPGTSSSNNSGAPSRTGDGVSGPQAPPTLKGASGPLPSELAMPGRWFARTVGEEAILLTFLPALDVWRKEVSARLERRRALREAREERARKTKVRSSSSRRGSSRGSLPPTGAGAEGSPLGEGGGGKKSEKRAGVAAGGGSERKEKDEDEDDSLGLFLFLVRSGDFGLPIEPQSAKLRDIRRILLAHIPLSHHRAMAFKPARRWVVVCLVCFVSRGSC